MEALRLENVRRKGIVDQIPINVAQLCTCVAIAESVELTSIKQHQYTAKISVYIDTCMAFIHLACCNVIMIVYRENKQEISFLKISNLQ